MSSRSWVYTLNNYTDEDIKQLQAFTVLKHRSAKEVGESGTPHLQGAITFTRTYRIKQLKKLNDKIHWEIARSKDAENYCTKGEIVIDVNNSKQGQRTDLEKIVSKIKDGSTIRSIALEEPVTYIKFHKGIQALKKEIQPRLEEFTSQNVVVIIGKPGKGKTKLVHQRTKDLYNVMEPINGSLWFDGYEGQTSILLDDFYGWIKYHTLLQLLDGYPMQLPIKGGTVWKNWTTTYITSNKSVKEWYNRDNIEALERRITQTIYLTY